LAVPGKYSAELYLVDNGNLQMQGPPREFMVKAVHNNEGQDYQAYEAFTRQTMELSRQLGNLNRQLGEAGNKLRHMAEAISQTPALDPALFKTHKDLQDELAALRESLNGDPIRSSKDEATTPGIGSKVWYVVYSHWSTTQMPTATQRQALAQAAKELTAFKATAQAYADKMTAYEKALEAAGAPYTPGRR
jgi:chromosome segregation ATPase